MGAADFLTRLTAAGFRLRASGDVIVVAPASKLTDDIRAEIRQSRREMLVLLKSKTTQACGTCRHLSRVKTCTKPVEAGLLPEFGITWPEPAYGATCPAWSLNPAEATMAVLVAAGRGGWSGQQMHAWLAEADAHPEAVLDTLRTGTLTP
jgi:hypothetical protein